MAVVTEERPLAPRTRLARPALVIGTAILALLVVSGIALPFYLRTTSRMYSSAIGYPAVLRRLGRPIPVQTTTAEERRIVRSILGEGTMAADSVLVPIVPLGTIVGVYVQPGQRVHKGDLMAEVDARKGRALAESARQVFLGAAAQLRRTQIGSSTLENREQPAKDAIDIKALNEQVAILKEEIATKEKLYDQSLVTKEAVLDARKMLTEGEQALEAARLSLRISTGGKSESERAAAAAAKNAEVLYQEALAELNDYKIVAPADGIVDTILIHVGEYPEVAGTPAFVLASGLWFEGYFDQSAVNEVSVGARAVVHLAARPGVAFEGRVVNVNSIVRYATGGPETGRPVRPIGTGGPEWPATFQARIELAPDALASLTPGLTGFARVVIGRNSVAVPEGAMLSMSSGNGLLFVVDGPKWEIRRARYGAAFDGWLEVLDGASAGEKVIVDGQQVLEPGDRLAESPWKPSASTR
jgi:HlyD family secretion protein